MEFGTLPDWLTGVVALAALVYARKAAKAAGGQLDTAQAQLKSLEAEAESRATEQQRAQASTVAVWLDRDSSGFQARYVNRSGLPIYDVEITFHSPNNHNRLPFRVLAPTDGPTNLPAVTNFVREAAETYDSVDVSWNLHRAGTGTLRVVGSDKLQATGRQDGTKIGPVGLTVEFNDSNNRRWCRDLDGRLTEVPPEGNQRPDGA